MDNIDKIFELYKHEYHEKQKNEKLYNHEKQLIINKKQQDLKILQTFLKKFVDHELYVSHKNTYTWQRKLNLDEEGEKFIFHLIEKSFPFVEINRFFFCSLSHFTLQCICFI